MDELQEINVEQIMGRIREHIRKRRSVGEGFMPSQDHAEISPAPLSFQIGPGEAPLEQVDHQVAADLAALHSGYDVYDVPFTSHRQFIGSFIVLAKKILRKLLNPILTRQVAYNAANARVAAYLQAHLEAIARQQAQLREQVQGTMATMAREIERLRNEVPTGHARAHELVQKQVSGAERKLRRVLYLLTDGQDVGEGFTPSRRAEETMTQAAPAKVPLQILEPDLDYFAFEERFRGSEEEIKQRQRHYVEYFRDKGDVLDIGCGRGEFLELLEEAGIQAKGVDLDLDMVLHCQDKGLDVVRKDAFAHLESLADESIGGIFAAQVIEHLEPSEIIRLVKLSQRKLRQGGVLILETPNPACLMVFAACFYMDFSHIRPVHPEAMKFLVESAGFDEVELKFSAPVEASMRIPPMPDSTPEAVREFNRGIERVNNLLYGFQDYAVIGKRSSSQ